MKFDLHMHTTFSDGDISPDLINSLILKNNDFAIVTDHDTAAYHLRPNSGCAFTGIEMTTNLRFDTRSRQIDERKINMLIEPIGTCVGCGEAVHPFREDVVFTCHYCREQYRQIDYQLIRVTQTQLPLTCVIDTPNGEITVDLIEVRERFEKAGRAMEVAMKEYQEACRRYEAARPRKPKA